MSNILTRLLFDTSDYDKNLGKAKGSAQAFASELGGAVAGAAMKLAGAMAAASGAAEVFDGVIRGSQATSDEFDRIIRSAQTTVESFFTAISTGDFTVFESGLASIVSKAREAQTALDQLGNTTMSYNYFNAKNQASFQDALSRARDESLSKGDRDAARKDAERIMAEQKEITDAYVFRTRDAMKKLVSEKNLLKPEDFDFLQVEDIFRVDVMVNSDEAKADLQATYDEYRNLLDRLKSRYEVKRLSGYDDRGIAEYKWIIEDVEGYNRELQTLNSRYADGVLYDTLLGKEKDKRLQEIMNLGQAAENANRNLASMEKSYVRINNTAIKAGTGGSSGVSGGKVGTKRADAMPVIVPQLQYDTELGRKVLAWMNGEDVPVISVPIEIEGEDIEEAPLPINKEAVKDVDDYVNSINALSNVMSALNTQTVEGAAGWLSWAGSLMTASAMAVDSIRKVVAAKTAEGAASAGAEAAKTPLVGWLLVGGAIASALAAFASIPSFAEGGVVPGANFRDGIAARLSSGEMVINPADQKKLFDSIHSGNLGGGGATRSVITGEQIVTVVNNYGRRTGRGTILKG